MLIWGSRETGPEESAPEEFTSEPESEFVAGLYTRAGIDIFFPDKFGLNFGARINETTLSFEDTAGKVDVEGWQYYISVALHFYFVLIISYFQEKTDHHIIQIR